MAKVLLENLSKHYNEVVAVKNLDLEIPDKEFVVLVGPSGCGKTTTLRMVAGLEDITIGNIYIDGKVVNNLPPKDRDIAMVFQNYALYPHMTVYENMAFGLKLRKFPKEEIKQRVTEAAEILNIKELLDRKPKALSGGQRQRVAVGRAIVRKPKVFLFDEPLSNLDAKLRVEMRKEIKLLHQRLQTTIIYVTHDQEEAMTLGDLVVVMRDGVIQQAGAALEVYHQPRNRFVAGFLGSPPMNFVTGKLRESEQRLWFEEGTFRLAVPAWAAAQLHGSVGKEVVLGVRPEALVPRQQARFTLSDDNAFSLQVTLVQPLGDRMNLYLATERHPHMVALVDSLSGVSAGHSVPMAVDPDRIHFFEPGDVGERIAKREGKELAN